jgi:transcriptional antiterminator RfaH
MAVLKEEPSLFPEDLLQESTSVAQLDNSNSGRVWWVMYTKSRQEKALARDLACYQLPFYLPQVRQDRLVRGRRVSTHVPVFPGYLFFFGSPDERVQSLTTNRISRILPVLRQDELVGDLRQLANLIAIGAPLTIEQRMAPGRKVRIRSGPMAGFEGTIIQRRGADRLLIAVSFLQQGVSVEINDFMVDPI